jgi:hypothetical protein
VAFLHNASAFQEWLGFPGPTWPGGWWVFVFQLQLSKFNPPSVVRHTASSGVTPSTGLICSSKGLGLSGRSWVKWRECGSALQTTVQIRGSSVDCVAPNWGSQVQIPGMEIESFHGHTEDTVWLCKQSTLCSDTRTELGEHPLLSPESHSEVPSCPSCSDILPGDVCFLNYSVGCFVCVCAHTHTVSLPIISGRPDWLTPAWFSTCLLPHALARDRGGSLVIGRTKISAVYSHTHHDPWVDTGLWVARLPTCHRLLNARVSGMKLELRQRPVSVPSFSSSELKSRTLPMLLCPWIPVCGTPSSVTYIYQYPAGPCFRVSIAVMKCYDRRNS